MTSIRIIRVPAGEAPETIRQAWVGVVLPLADGKLGQKRSWLGFGVLSGPKTWITSILALFRGRYISYEGYMVDAKTAFERLAESNPVAAQWWYDNASHLLGPAGKLLFEADVCEVITDDQKAPG